MKIYVVKYYDYHSYLCCERIEKLHSFWLSEENAKAKSREIPESFIEVIETGD